MTILSDQWVVWRRFTSAFGVASARLEPQRRWYQKVPGTRVICQNSWVNFEPAPPSGKVNVMLLLFSDCYKQDVDRTKKDTIRTLKTIYGWYKCTIRMSFYKTIFSPFLFPFQRNSLISHKIPLDSASLIILQSSPLVGVDYLMVEDLSSILLSPLWIYSFEGSLLFFTIHFSYRHKCGLAGASVLRQDL